MDKKINILYLADSISRAAIDLLSSLSVRVLVAGRGSEYQFAEDSIDTTALSEEQLVNEIKNKNFYPQIVLANSEQYVRLKAYICEQFDIPFISLENVDGVIEKDAMRAILIERAPHITPSFKVIDSEKDLFEFTEKHGYPVMLKPAALDRSRLVIKANNHDEARAFFNDMRDRITSLYDKRANDTSPKIIVEQYMTGPKYSVEGVVDKNGVLYTPDTVTDLWFGYDIGINDPMNYLRVIPSMQSKETVNKLIACAKDAVAALKMKSCSIHAELIMVDGEAKLIEIAARVGGYREEMYRTCFGYSLVEAEIRVQLGETNIDFSPRTVIRPTAALKVYALEEGILKTVENVDLISSVASFMYSPKTGLEKIGELVGPSRLGYHEVLSAFMSNENEADLLHDCNLIQKKVVAVVEKIHNT